MPPPSCASFYARANYNKRVLRKLCENDIRLPQANCGMDMQFDRSPCGKRYPLTPLAGAGGGGI